MDSGISAWSKTELDGHGLPRWRTKCDVEDGDDVDDDEEDVRWCCCAIWIALTMVSLRYTGWAAKGLNMMVVSDSRVGAVHSGRSQSRAVVAMPTARSRAATAIVYEEPVSCEEKESSRATERRRVEDDEAIESNRVPMNCYKEVCDAGVQVIYTSNARKTQFLRDLRAMGYYQEYKTRCKGRSERRGEEGQLKRVTPSFKFRFIGDCKYRKNKNPNAGNPQWQIKFFD